MIDGLVTLVTEHHLYNFPIVSQLEDSYHDNDHAEEEEYDNVIINDKGSDMMMKLSC